MDIRVQRHPLIDPDATRIVLAHDGAPLSWAQVLEGLVGSARLRATLTRTIAELPYAAILWETPPVSRSTVDLAFEFVALDCPALAGVTPEPAPFAEYLSDGGDVVAFGNLGGDAQLVVPRPLAPPAAYPHLTAFVRHAPPQQVDRFWGFLAIAVRAELDDAPRWVSTSGLGVHWVHARIDRGPKYYAHAPYTRWPRPTT